ncbi:MAG: hypothetical protein WCS37_21115 [Chloroflexota bacterium]|nr:hypothetical protein [Chloroflexota bacterium]
MMYDLSGLLDQIPNLSYDELLTLQEHIIQQLRVTLPISRPLTVSLSPLQLNAYPWNNWPSEATFRRGEIYDDDGR